MATPPGPRKVCRQPVGDTAKALRKWCRSETADPSPPSASCSSSTCRTTTFPAAAPPLTFSVGKCREFLQRRPSRIRLATTRRSPPRSSPSGFTAWSPALVDPRRTSVSGPCSATMGDPSHPSSSCVFAEEERRVELRKDASRVLPWKRRKRGYTCAAPCLPPTDPRRPRSFPVAAVTRTRSGRLEPGRLRFQVHDCTRARPHSGQLTPVTHCQGLWPGYLNLGGKGGSGWPAKK